MPALSDQLSGWGFAPVARLTDQSRTRAPFRMIFFHARRGLFADILFSPRRRGRAYLRFFAFLSSNAFISVDNLPAPPPPPTPYHRNLSIYHDPGASSTFLFHLILHRVDRSPGRPAAMDLRRLLLGEHRIRRAMAERMRREEDRPPAHRMVSAMAAFFLLAALAAGALLLAFPETRGAPMRLAVRLIAPFLDLESPTVALPLRWEKNFGPGGARAVSSVIISDGYIVSTPEALTAIDMRTGDRLWRHEALAGAALRIPGGHRPAPPFLLIDRPATSGRPRLLRLDPETGRIAWEKTPPPGAAMACDDSAVLLWDAETLRLLDGDGRLLWTLPALGDGAFGGKAMVSAVISGDALLLERRLESEQILSCRHRSDGRLLWRETRRRSPGYGLGDGYHFLTDAAGRTELVFLPENRALWTLPPAAGAVKAHVGDPVSGGIIYAQSAALSARDGAELFPYPPKSTFGCLSRDLLTLIDPGGMLLFLRRAEGTAVALYRAAHPPESIAPVYEDAERLALALAYRPAPDARYGARRIDLLVLEKSTGRMRTLTIGRNLPAEMIRIYPNRGVLVVPLGDRIGGFGLPPVERQRERADGVRKASGLIPLQVNPSSASHRS